MALERRDPLPAGRYSIFVNEAETSKWSAWVTAHKDSVKVIGSIAQRVTADGLPLFSVDTNLDVIWKTIGTAFLFTVSASTPWVGLGFPDIETRTTAEWIAEKTETPEYIPEATPLDEIRNIVLFGGAVYLGGILLQKALRS